MIAAYAAARAAVSGHLVLCRVGEFYEVLGDDAAAVSRLLGIQLARRRMTPGTPVDADVLAAAGPTPSRSDPTQ